jgi:hypothetical protein
LPAAFFIALCPHQGARFCCLETAHPGGCNCNPPDEEFRWKDSGCD